MATTVKEIKFLAIARKSDKVLLASHTATADRSYDFVGNVNKVMGSPGWASVTTDKLSLDDPPNMLYVSLDEVRGGLAAGEGRGVVGGGEGWGVVDEGR